MVQRLGRPWRSDTDIAVSLCGMYFKSLPENWNANHGELAKLLARRKQILLGKASRNGFQTPWNLLVACADKSTQSCCSTSAVGSGAVKKRTTVSHTCAKLWKQCMRDEVKKSCFGDPSWKKHFQKLHEMQVLEASCVQKRTTPSREPSLVFWPCRWFFSVEKCQVHAKAEHSKTAGRQKKSREKGLILHTLEDAGVFMHLCSYTCKYTYMVSHIYYLYIYIYICFANMHAKLHIPRNGCYLHFMFACVVGTISIPTKAHRWHHSHGSGGFGRYKKKPFWLLRLLLLVIKAICCQLPMRAGIWHHSMYKVSKDTWRSTDCGWIGDR